MTITPTRSDAMRRTETPNAVMTTIASPTQGPTAELSIWKVHMRAGQQGPLHVFDSEQVWHVVGGEIDVAVDEASQHLRRGDAVVIAAAATRQVTARTDADLIVCGRGDAVASIPGETSTRGVPAWIS